MTTEMQPGDLNRTVYVVANWPSGGNDRVRKLLRLRECVGNLVLVSPGKMDQNDADTLVVKPIPNPFGVLRVLGLKRLKAALERALFFPSVSVLFTRRACRQIEGRIRRDIAEGREVTLLTTAPPHALGLIGLYIKTRHPQVHWVVDWQDLWSYDENYFLRSPVLYRPAVRRLEKRMFDTADLNLTTNERACRVLVDHYGVVAERAAFVHHHFDRSDFGLRLHDPAAATGDRQAARTSRIGFLGTLFKPPRVPGMEVVNAIEQMRRRGTKVELHLHGWVTEETRELVASKEGLVVHGRTTHEESVRQLARYDYVLLLLSDLRNCRAVMSIKLPHYMLSGVPILAIVPGDSAIADIVRRTGTGYVIPVEGDWRGALAAILAGTDDPAQRPVRQPEQIEAFSWQRISQQWLDILRGRRAGGVVSATDADSRRAAG